MKKKALRNLGKVAAKRASGSGVGMFEAQVTAVLVGIAAAVATYKLLRSGG